MGSIGSSRRCRASSRRAGVSRCSASRASPVTAPSRVSGSGTLPVIWIDIDDPEPSNIEDDATAVYRQGRNKGGAKFLSGEGCTYRNGSVVFDSSDGGDAGLGQIWEYTPKTNIGEADEEGELVLLYESTDKLQLDGPDNMCTSPGARSWSWRTATTARTSSEASCPTVRCSRWRRT
jgi:hypothetical protein